MISVTPPPKKLRASVAIVNDTIYQADSDGTVIAYTDNTSNNAKVYVDSITPPTTLKNGARTESTGSPNGCSYPVKKGDYYKVSGSDGAEWIANK